MVKLLFSMIMKKKPDISTLLIVLLFLFSSNARAGEIIYLDKQKNESLSRFIDLLKNSIKEGKDNFSDLLGEKISYRIPINSAVETEFSKNKFLEEFNGNYESYKSVSYLYGILFDNNYALKNFSVTCYKDADFNIVINKSYRNDYAIYLYKSDIDLTTLTFGIKDNKIMSIGTYFRYALGLDYRGEFPNYYVMVNTANIYKTEEMKEIIGTLHRNEKVEFIRKIKKVKPFKNEFMMKEELVSVCYIKSNELNIEGYVFRFDITELESTFEIYDNPSIEENRYSIFYTPKVDNLRLRDKPNVDGKLIRFLKKGEVLRVYQKSKEEIVNGESGNWIYVETKDGKYGWCFDFYLEESNYKPEN
jgi:hypothetical protein